MRRCLNPLSSIALLAATATAQAATPPPDTAAAVLRGKALFAQHCTSCHGADGRSQIDLISDATDLTDPSAYYSGSTDAEMFSSIKNGAGVGMPAWSLEFKDDQDIWSLVYFVRSLWIQTEEPSNDD